MMILFIGVTASQAFQTEKTVTVQEGGFWDFEGYRLEFVGMSPTQEPNVETWTTTVRVYEGDRQVDVLRPERRFYRQPEQPTSEIDRYTPLKGDLYLVFIDYDPRKRAAVFKTYSNPLVKFVWVGWIVVILGTGVAALPELQRAPVRAAAREARVARPA